MNPEQRKKLERAVWSKTHRDFRGMIDGVRTILVLRPDGTTLVPMSGLTNDELADKARLKGLLPPEPPVPCAVCGAKNTAKLFNGSRKCGLCGTVKA